MPNEKLTVVISAGQSRNPEKRELEQGVAELASQLPGVNVLRIPHLYDLTQTGETYQALSSLSGDLVVISWLFSRAAHWILDRNGVRGQVGTVELLQDMDEEDEAYADEPSAEQRVIESQPRPIRQIFCIDFRAANSPADFQAELIRIHQSRQNSNSSVGGPLSLETLARMAAPTNDTFLGADHNAAVQPTSRSASTLFGMSSVVAIEEHPARRWYPVIDFSRCTNCMECIDFCLFGVYGVDSMETIVVEQADNCRKGCPACSRVCPQNAIVFPQHKTPAIAGAPVDAGGLKIDLSKLFGAPDDGEDAAAVALRERDEQLVLAGRTAVGASTGISERLANNARQAQHADDLDELIDQLDSLDL